MCSKARCRSCGKTTWSGCGAHVQQVMAGVPKAQQCTCERAAGSGDALQRFATKLFGGRGSS
jgi:hypothetical protein